MCIKFYKFEIMKKIFYVGLVFCCIQVYSQNTTSELIFDEISIYQYFGGQWIQTENTQSVKEFYWDNKEKKLMTEEGGIFDLTLLKTEENTQHYLTQDGVGMVFRWKTIKNKKYPYILEIYREKKEGQYMKCFKYKNTQI